MRKEDLLLDAERASRLYLRLKNGYWGEESIPLRCQYAVSDEPVPWRDREKGEFRELREGDRWGTMWQSAWMHITGRIPDAWRGRNLALRINVAGESLLFDAAGVPFYGLCSSSCMGNDYVKEYFDLPAETPAEIDLWLEAAANGMFGLEDITDTPNLRNPRFGDIASKQAGFCRKMRLVTVDTEMQELFYDVETVWDLARNLGEKDYRYTELIRALNAAFAAMDDDPANAAKARACLAPILRRPAMASAKRVTAVGHSHIDVGWLWPVRESIRKSARTFASQIYNIEHFPEFIFGASQPHNYQSVKERYPELFEKIREQVRQGRWEPQGGMWVEADCNLINGESMVRQFLHGKNFFMDEFGFEVKNLWAPDVFGYPASIPQIMLKAGCRHFVTQKLCKNRVNEFPYHTFYWTGVDGSRVLAHFLPENDYNSAGNAGSYIRAQNRFAERDFMGEFLSLVGIGDGGGGPAPSHVFRLRRCRDTEGVPAVKFGTAAEYFDRVEAKYAADFPEWNGELYLEIHQGTYTSQARMKNLNRRAEQQLNAAEILLLCAGDENVRAQEMDKLWKTLFCNQFHDILPGSCIGMVYERSEPELAKIIARCGVIQRESAAKFLTPATGALTLVNTLSSPCELPLALPESWGGAAVTDAAGRELPSQNEDGTVVTLAPVAGFSCRELRPGVHPAATVTADAALVLENALVRYTFAPDGTLTEAFDKTENRELLAAGECGNQLVLYSDVPNSFDAWNLDVVYRKGPAHRPCGVEHSPRYFGAVRSYLTFTGRIGEKSSFRQKVILDNDSKLLTFETVVQWHETHRMFRVAFPLSLAAKNAAYEIPYACIARPTGTNTSWEAAQHEVALQRYMDLSEADYGAAILNDCKYGGKIFGSRMELTLLRSPKYPDYNADMGEQNFTYAFLPHAGELSRIREVRDKAAALNRVPLFLPGRSGDGPLPLPCRVTAENVSLEAVKKAEKDDSVILRLVETQGRRGRAVIRPESSSAVLTETDLMEWRDGAPLELRDGGAEVEFAPFEIRTFRLKRA